MEVSENSDEEWELVGEEYVVIDLVGMIDKDVIKNCDKSKVKLIGMLDAEEPVLQLDNSVFIGKREDAPGTCVLFQKDEVEEDAISDDEHNHFQQQKTNSTAKTSLTYHCCTNKKLIMHQTFLTAKQT
uniref:General transcription factor 3C polypeptide 6-like n=1 Tax=Phallusia mammillata TaxID=59560 RepID=A0A6F9DDI8_9ASCI|nr:general transcription factor 3C polypeptide 6-like [Phallusia mammillata]